MAGMVITRLKECLYNYLHYVRTNLIGMNFQSRGMSFLCLPREKYYDVLIKTQLNTQMLHGIGICSKRLPEE